ncbi:MAG: glutathione transferase GstA [Thiotrichaceae bacterium]|nr:MAG: glutathione transferase GstA [Thiotrichaceae bacterium]
MKLYYSPGTCSLSPHIALCEAELPYELVLVDIQQATIENGGDYHTVNPFGYVPALALDNDEILLEGPAIVQYIADQVPSKQLAPAAGEIDRYRLQQWLNFISTELHKGLGALFNPALPDEARELFKGIVNQRLDIVAPQLENSPFIMGETFTVADGYLFTVLSWGPHIDFELTRWPALQAYLGRVAARPAVQKALKEEGLLPE